MAKKAMIEYAYEIMQEKKSISFSTLWASVSKKAELTDQEKEKALPNFYTQLSLDDLKRINITDISRKSHQLIVIDQFEELFVLGKEDIELVNDMISNLIEFCTPDFVK